MRDRTGKPVHGRTRWRRFLIILGPSVGVVALMMYLVATGALALNIAISGMPFKLSATSLSGDHFVQFGAVTQVTNENSGALVNSLEQKNGISLPGNTSQVGGDGKTYLADTVTLLQSAQIVGLHQTVCAPIPQPIAGFFSIPALQVTISASGTATAPALTVQAPALTADLATFTNIIIGEDANKAFVGYGYSPNALGDPALNGNFAQAADHVVISGLTQIAVGTEAGTFSLPGLQLGASFVSSCS